MMEMFTQLGANARQYVPCASTGSRILFAGSGKVACSIHNMQVGLDKTFISHPYNTPSCSFLPTVLQIHQAQKKLLYIAILTYPTTGGVTASFGMLGDIIIAEPKAYIAFAGKRVIEQTLRQKIPDGFQVAESLFDHGLLDLIVPRNLLKGVLREIFELYNSAPYKEHNNNFFK